MIDITNPGDIDRFKALLIGAAMTRDTDSDWDYRFDIDAERYAGRWLYSTKTGRMASLNYRLSPRLILRDREGLNRFITDMRKKYK